MTRTQTWRRTAECNGSSTRAWACRAAVATEIARAVRFWPRLAASWPLRPAAGAMMPLNGVDQQLPTLSPATPRAAPLEGGHWGGRWTTGRASARCGTRKSARWKEIWLAARRWRGRRRGRRPRTPQWGDLELCCWGWRGDMYALMVSKFRSPNYRPPGVGGAFAICGLEKKVPATGEKFSQQEAGAGAPRTFWRDFSVRPGQGHPKGPRTAEKVRHRVRGGWVGGWGS